MSSHSLWNWLKSNKLEIPRMQRDYAQGRIGRHVLRHRFLESLIRALESDSGVASLDFVYGTERPCDDDSVRQVVSPLDGQQRLTTLWLLHWYLAMRTGALEEAETHECLKRLSYETRETSRTFCERLVEEWKSIREKMTTYHGLEAAIRCQTWFSPSFETDPTVTGMLRMLVGTKNQHKDCIDLWFKDATEDELSRYWKRLTSKSCPITFFYQDLGALSDPDGLYIKMNARGKPLTPFENFKAELVADVGTNTPDLREGDKLRIEVAGKLDNEWTDVFWTVPKEEAGPKGEVPASYDDRYLAFFKRLAFNALVTARKKGEGDAFVVRDDGDFEEKTKRLTRFGFESLDDYEELLKNHKRGYFDVLDQLSILKKKECTFDDIVQGCAPEWFVDAEWVKSFRFVPDDSSFKCDTQESKDKITQPGRAWFLSLCRFLEKVQLTSTSTDWESEFTEWKEKLRTWLRVVANIIENAGIDTAGSMLSTMRLLDELSDHAGDILGFLSTKGSSLQSDAVKKQRDEEIEKARYLVAQQRTEAEKEFLKSVEAYACCRGAVRWLYRDGKGQVDWDSFAKKAERLRSLFPDDGRWSRAGAYAELVRHWKEEYIKQDVYKGIVFSRTAKKWKESVFRVMCDGKDEGKDEVLWTGLDTFLRGDQQSPEPVGMVLCLVRGLERIEEKDCWPGENKDDFPGWRILTDWHVGRGKGEERDYEAVLTAYKVRTDPPDKLFVDLSSTPEEAEREVDRYYAQANEGTHTGGQPYVGNRTEKKRSSMRPVESETQGNEILGKAIKRLPKWARNSEGMPYRIIRAFLMSGNVEDINSIRSLDKICRLCSNEAHHPDMYVEKFAGCWANLKTDAGNAYGRMFVQNGDDVSLPPKVALALKPLVGEFLKP